MESTAASAPIIPTTEMVKNYYWYVTKGITSAAWDLLAKKAAEVDILSIADCFLTLYDEVDISICPSEAPEEIQSKILRMFVARLKLFLRQKTNKKTEAISLALGFTGLTLMEKDQKTLKYPLLLHISRALIDPIPERASTFISYLYPLLWTQKFTLYNSPKLSSTVDECRNLIFTSTCFRKALEKFYLCVNNNEITGDQLSTVINTLLSKVKIKTCDFENYPLNGFCGYEWDIFLNKELANGNIMHFAIVHETAHIVIRYFMGEPNMGKSTPVKAGIENLDRYLEAGFFLVNIVFGSYRAKFWKSSECVKKVQDPKSWNKDCPLFEKGEIELCSKIKNGNFYFSGAWLGKERRDLGKLA